MKNTAWNNAYNMFMKDRIVFPIGILDWKDITLDDSKIFLDDSKYYNSEWCMITKKNGIFGIIIKDNGLKYIMDFIKDKCGNIEYVCEDDELRFIFEIDERFDFDNEHISDIRKEYNIDADNNYIKLSKYEQMNDDIFMIHDELFYLLYNEWKKMSSLYSKYSGSTKGKLRNDETGYISIANPRKDDGYIDVNVRLDHGNRTSKQTISLQVLIAKIFVKNPDTNTKTQVNHINEIRDDNSILNLEWVTPQENSNKRSSKHNERKKKRVAKYSLDNELIKIYDCIEDAANDLDTKGELLSKMTAIIACCNGKTQYLGYSWKYYNEFIEDEVWKELYIGGRNINASSYGRIGYKNILTYGNFVKGYLKYDIDKNGYFVHRLIMMAFNPIENDELCIVNHKDKNPLNNKLENLEWLTQLENMRYSSPYYNKEVYQIDKDSNEIIAKYKNIFEIEDKLDIKHYNISRCCNKKTTISFGFKWKFVDDNI